MKQFFAFVQKEFLHIFRDKRTMLMLLAMPVVQLLIFGYAISTEINNTPFAVIDNSKSSESRKLVEAFSNSKYFNFVYDINNIADVESAFMKGKIKIAIVIPSYFSKQPSNVQLISDASEPNEASVVTAYANQIIMRFIIDELKLPAVGINTELKMLYNPQMKSAYNFVPGLMGLILMLICAMMTSIAIVREKEQGTMEILLVSPVKPWYVIISKTIPYLIISMIDVSVILIISTQLMGVPIAGSLFTLVLLSTVFTMSALSLGLLISSIAKTQQAAMLISGVGLMLPTILLSGLIFPIENMPLPLRIASNILPAKWFISAVRDVMIKGLSFGDIIKEFSVLAAMTMFLITMSIKSFKNRL